MFACGRTSSVSKLLLLCNVFWADFFFAILDAITASADRNKYPLPVRGVLRHFADLFFVSIYLLTLFVHEAITSQ